MTLANVVTGITTISMSVLKHLYKKYIHNTLLPPSPPNIYSPNLPNCIAHFPVSPYRSAICTNGQISSGGVYYMISRCCWILTKWAQTKRFKFQVTWSRVRRRHWTNVHSRQLHRHFHVCDRLVIMIISCDFKPVVRYVIGFCESILDLCNAKIEGFTGIIDGGINDVRWKF